ncbi:mandelate racemase [Actinomyces ruminis]|uniref:Mandelate racemase n=1 Tax=Actinomyces ruminis TaxID=1937003 RepID=A0ABX4MAX5_9ACTO|nr:mandelate racemase [Actinomyces ruminis]
MRAARPVPHRNRKESHYEPPVVDAVAVTTSQSTTSTRGEFKATDLLTFQIGLLVIGAVLMVMTVVGLVTASAPLLIAAVLFAAVAMFASVHTAVNLLAD